MHYELPLLAQSIIMIVCMTVMIQLCVRVGNEGVSPIVHKSFWGKWICMIRSYFSDMYVNVFVL